MTMDRPGPLRGLPLLEDLGDLDGRKVLVRTDFNVPLEGCGANRSIADDFRIKSALPTLRWLLDQGAVVTTCSHLGRPTGPGDPDTSMDPVRAALDQMCPGVELLENLRWNKGEKKNDPAFAAQLAEGHDFYVNEAFGVSHRREASVVGVPKLLPSAAGMRLAQETEIIGGLLIDPARPFVAVVGGAKVADKLGVLEALAKRVDVLCVGGGMAYTFLAAMGFQIGASLCDPDRIEDCRRLLDGDTQIVLPTDVLALEPGGLFGGGLEIALGPRGRVEHFEGNIPFGWNGLDIGPATRAAFAEVIAGAGTVLWNGPVGAFEDDRFVAGTQSVARAVASCPGFSIVGGGDSACAIDGLGLAEQIDFVSTGGGATLELLEHGDLPGLIALRQAPNAQLV